METSRNNMYLIYLIIACLNLSTFIQATELFASNKTNLFDKYYNLLLNNENKTTSSNVIKIINHINVDVKKLIRQHENLHLIQINTYEGFFLNNELNLKPYCVLTNEYLRRLKILNLSNNNIKNITVSENTFCKFQSLKYVDLSFNKLTTLNQDQFNVFKVYGDEKDISVNVELLKLDHNEIRFIKSNTFKNFIKLKYLDLSFNKLKYLHPLVLNLNTELLDLSNNNIQQLYKQNYQNLKYLYLNSNNLQLKCDCLLTDLLMQYKSNQISIDDFSCYLQNKQVLFKQLNEAQLNSECNNISTAIDYKIDPALQKSSIFSYLTILANKWFTWYVWREKTKPIEDILPKIPLLIDNYDSNNTSRLTLNLTANRLTDINVTCQAANDSSPNSIVVWKTPFGYFSKEENATLFHKMSNLTKIYKHLRFNTGPPPLSGANSINDLYISNNSELILTNFRQRYTGEFTCFVLNPINYASVTFNLKTRVGVGDYFLYCLSVSVIISLVSSITGIILCIICEKQAVNSFPMTPPVFPTPLGTVPTTPPNFDFNQWMSNTASNIQGTLDQASKKLRKGLEKASTTVKSIGVTSTAYFYSVYEQSTQRLHTIKSYKLPTLPTVSLPTMKYSNQLATRMGRLRTGVENFVVQFREFCGTSDIHNAQSIATINSETNASNSVGQIVGNVSSRVMKISHMDQSMNFIAEEGNLNAEENEDTDSINEENYEKITKLDK